MLFKMFVLILFMLVKLSSAYQCIEFKSFRTLDCSGLDISTFPRYAERNWVEVLILENNNLTSVNLSAIMTDFPKIRYIDLRDNPLDCTMPLIRVRVDISSDCPHSTIRPTATATTSFIQHKSTNMLSTAAPRTSQTRITPSSASVPAPSPANVSTPSPTRTGKNHTLLIVLSILIPAGVTALVIACLYAIRRMRRRRRPSVYDELFVLNNVRGHFSIDSLSSDSLDEEINYLQDSAF